MADELTLDSQLSFAKNGVSMAGGPYHASVDVTGNHFVQNTVVLDQSGDTTLPFGDIDTPGYVLLNAVRAVAAPDAPTSIDITNQGIPGVTSYTYKVVTVGLGAIESAASEAFVTTTGNATLSGSNYNQIEWTPVEGATSYKLYRTAGGATQGLINSAIGSTPTVGVIRVSDDNDGTGDSATPPTEASITGFDPDLSVAYIDNETDIDALALKIGEFALFRLNGTEINAISYDFPIVLEYTVFED